MKAALGEHKNPNVSPRAAFVSLLLMFFLLSTSCGLPSIPYLYPPSEFDVSSSSIKIKNNMENYQASEGINQSYLGLEIYYHVYETQSAAGSAYNQLVSFASNYENSPSTFVKTLTGSNYRFQRLRNANSNSPVLIPVANPALPVSYYINLSQTSAWRLTDENGAYFPSGDEALSTIRRNVPNRVPVDAGFHAMDFRSGDEDYTGITSLPSTVYILMFGISYGQDPVNIGVPIYSAPSLDSDIITFSTAG
jgi:hypothetical protein